MTRNHYLAIDLGATSGRAVLGTFDGQKINMMEISRFGNPIVRMGGHVFFDLPALYNEIILAFKKVADEGIGLTSIGIDTWGCDFALFGKDGQLLGLPYFYRDSHTAGAQEQFFSRMSAAEVYDATGIQFMDFNSLFQLDTLRRNGCSALAAADKILFIPDALIYLLTGKAVCEYTVASTSQMLNPASKNLDGRILEVLGIDRAKFGDMVMPGTVVGTLSSQVQEITGLPDVPVVAVAGHDTASAVASIPAADEDYAYLSCGTWSLLGVELNGPIINKEGLRYNFTNEGGVDGTTRFLKNICGLWIFEQCRKEFRDVPESVAELVALCDTTDFPGLIDPDAECFVNPLSMTGVIDEYCRKTGQQVPAAPAEYIRCIFRSLALRYRQVTEILRTLVPVDIRRLNVIGGGSRNRYLMQYAADALDMPVVCGPVEGTALGNVLLQLKASGLVSSLQEMRKVTAASIALVTYSPCERAGWDEAYRQFTEIQKLYNN